MKEKLMSEIELRIHHDDSRRGPGMSSIYFRQHQLDRSRQSHGRVHNNTIIQTQEANRENSPVVLIHNGETCEKRISKNDEEKISSRFERAKVSSVGHGNISTSVAVMMHRRSLMRMKLLLKLRKSSIGGLGGKKISNAHFAFGATGFKKYIFY